MSELTLQIVAVLVCTTLFCVMTMKMLGVMQQCGYKNATFFRWLRRKDNMFFNKLCVLALCLAMPVCVTALCFSFLGERGAILVSALVFLVFTLAYLVSDAKSALKVPLKRTGRTIRLFCVYVLLTALVLFGSILLLDLLREVNGSRLYRIIGYVPFALTVVVLPFVFALANALTGIFENARNKGYVKRAGQVLSETDVIRVGVVGSYGKTSVKNILKTLLSEKFSVIETPASYNTPVGIAKTVFSPEFSDKQVFIAEMGARKRGDIQELCALVKPDFAVFTGVCNQHVETFKTLENVFLEKSEIIKSGAKCVCAESLRGRVEQSFTGAENVIFADAGKISNVQLLATETAFCLQIGEETLSVRVPLLGETAVENILLAVSLAVEMGLTSLEIKNGLSKLQAVPHRLQLTENGGVYILDDGYNANEKGAREAVQALARFSGRKCIVTPGLVECGVLEQALNEKLGEEIAKAGIDKVILVGETLVCAVKRGYEKAGGTVKTEIVRSLSEAQTLLSGWVASGDAVLFLNDLPDAY